MRISRRLNWYTLLIFNKLCIISLLVTSIVFHHKLLQSWSRNLRTVKVPDRALVTILYLSKWILQTMLPSFIVHNGLISLPGLLVQLAIVIEPVLRRRGWSVHDLIVPSAEPVTSLVVSNCRHTMPPLWAFQFLSGSAGRCLRSQM